MRSSLIDARPVASAPASHSWPAPNPQRSPVPPPTAPVNKRKKFSLAPAEGWLPLLLLTVAVYSVVYSVTAAIAINHTVVLWATTALGLLCGLIVSKTRFFPQAIMHVAACILGYWLALLLTSALAYHVSLLVILSGLRSVIAGGFSLAGSSQSDMIFLFYLAFLCFFLGYFGSWLIYRAHLPWLVALVYVSIMIVNLNYIAKRDLTYLVIILVAAMIPLIARVQLAGQLAQWKSDGLYTDQAWMRNLTSRLLRVVSLFIVIILPLSWLFPVLSQPSAGASFWDRLDNAWANISHGNLASLTDPNSLFSPYQPAANFFGDQLSITGSVNLPDGPVISYTSTLPTQGFYLEGFTFDTFDGHTWSSQLQSAQNYTSNNSIGSGDMGLLDTDNLTSTITVLQPPGGSRHYIFAPADPNKFNVPITVLTDPTGTFTGAWTQTAPLTQNERYQVLSTVSTASPSELQRLGLPGKNLLAWGNDPTFSTLRQYYLQLPRNLSPEVLATAQRWTQDKTTLYAVVTALQSHLSNPAEFTYSVTNPPVPSNVDAVTWLLHTHKGYCTYYATAMVVMARQLGIPARMVNGFSQGTYNAQQKAWIVNGSDAHSWVQIYFPNYGWMNFDPTPGFFINNAGAPAPAPSPTATTAPAGKSPTAAPSKQPTPKAQATATPQHGAGSTATSDSSGPGSGVNVLLSFALLALFVSCVVLAFAVVRYRRVRLVAQGAVTSVYQRLCRVASLLGSPPAAWQTPYEYTFALSRRFPQASASLRRLADLFVRERWASPQQAPAPAEQQELERLWPGLRNALLRSRVSKFQPSQAKQDATATRFPTR